MVLILEFCRSFRFLQQLNLAAIFWRSCASLTACSPEFRYQLSNHNLALQARRLLQLVVQQAVRGPNDEGTLYIITLA
jgi:hypothetical protein